ncbi:MAG: von Willebrand factor type A domain-containing protein [Salinivirgaceae bacterium]|jgi:Ca-activated chloride channel family protein|nr:von Willebrand factor type A domain-containing protein [Salinivirgaceae bacterium]
MRTKALIISITFSLVLLVSTSFGQRISGIVTSSNDGLPLPGATIMLKGTQIGTVANMNGRYAIEIDSLHKTLVFAFIGFETEEIKVKGRTTINVNLQEDNTSLQEIVIRGVATQNEVQMTSCVAQITKGGKHKMGNRRNFAMGMECEVADYDINQQFNTEGYTAIHENGFKKVSMNPLSTFSIDVDAASYSNMRRYINNGNLPPIDAVRIEEMINYFTYEYAQPKGDDPFSINTELAACPWNKDNYLLHVGLQGKKLDMDELPPSNIVFLLDVSGSMSDLNKLPLLKSSLKLLVDQLRSEDRVAIVVYAGSSGLVLPSTPGNQKQTILKSLNKLNAGGSTAGGSGLKLAYKVAEENFMENGNNRIVLATDGDFNIGQSSNAEMERLIEKEREKGIAISVLGFGMGNYKDDKMEIIADKGNGNYSYIDNLQEAKKVLVNEFGGTLFTIAKDVKFQLEFNPANVAEYRLIGYENRILNSEDFDNDKKDAGEMGAGHTVTALYEIVPAKKSNETKTLKYQNTTLSQSAVASNDLITLKLRYKQPDGFKSKLIERVVKNELIDVNATSNNFRYSASVAEFGMLLRDSEFKGTATFDTARELAKGSKGEDEEGYRGEMIRLIKSAALLKDGSALK